MGRPSRESSVFSVILNLSLWITMLLLVPSQAADEDLSRGELVASIEKGLASSLGKSGFVEKLTISLEGCDLTIRTDYARHCSPINNGALLSDTVIIDIRELSSDADDLTVGPLSIGVLGLTWKFKREFRNAPKFTAYLSVDPSPLFSEKKAPAQITRRSREVYHSCLTPSSTFPLFGRISLFFDNRVEENLEDNLRILKTKYCK